MYVLVCYDVSVITKEGVKRLRKVAKLCENYGQRVQNSVFECDVGEVQWATLKFSLLSTFKSDEDSLRFYYLGDSKKIRNEHHGVKPSIDFRGPLII